jgi:solute carrier family 25 (mitochondrial iron transporter), member 28/37
MQILPSLSPASLLSTANSTSPAPLSLAQHFRLISAREGLRTLWRGVASVIMGAGPAHAAHFGTYEFIREISGGREDGMRGFVGTG